MAASPSIDFDNTEIAFRSRTTAALRKAQVLFRSFNYPALIHTGPKLVGAALRLKLPVTPLIRMTIFDYFCGGVTLADCDRTVADLARFGVRSILDYSVEALGREADLDATRDEVLRSIEKARGNAFLPYVVFKPTGLARFELLEKLAAGTTLTQAETAEWERVRKRFGGICRAAREAALRVLVDAEESWIQPAVDRLVLEMMREFNRDGAVVYNTLQMYRKDRLAYLQTLLAEGLSGGFHVGAKLVRGAYMEKERARAAARGYPSPIQDTKEATDRAYDQAALLVVDHLDRAALFAGTHNESSTSRLTELIDRRGLVPSDRRIEFSQLYGMSDHLTYNLAHHGFNVSKYVPYGPIRAVLPYLVRRAEENSSIKGQAGRELQLIERELKRRSTH